jgi:hypothetical protein
MMAAYSDQVRSVDHELPILGSPDVRLHLPKHYALASWVTPEGRQPTFIAQTSPVAVDPERIAWHHRCQKERGGRELDSFRQPHWDREDDQGEDPHADGPQPTVASGGTALRPGRATHRSDPTGERERDDFAELRDLLRSEAAQRTQTAPPVVPSRRAPDAGKRGPDHGSAATARQPSATEPPASYAELVAVDEATRVTWPRKTEPRTVTADATDLELLGWLTELRFALATQIHRRFGAGKSYSTTQRRLKKLSEAGWVHRFQFFRDTGASSALTYLVTDIGIATVREAIGPHGPYLDPRRESSAPSTDDPAMRRARHDLHVNAWGLAFEAHLGEVVRRIRGPRNSYVAPPTRSAGGERRAIGPDELRLPGGRRPHGFLRTDRARHRIEVEEFAAIEPDLTIELRLREAERIVVTDLFVELDRTFKPAKNIDKFERYDH